MKAVLRSAAAVAAVLVLVAVGVMVWANLSLDRSSVARALVWRQADVDDHLRFPSRPMPASSFVTRFDPTPLRLGALDTVPVPGRGEERLDALLERTGTTAFIVISGDQLLVERYYNGSARDATQTSFSVAKSFMSTLFGLALDQGHLARLEDSVTAYIPELLDRDERFAQIRLRHLLTMSSGLRYRDQGTPWSDDATTYYAPDLRRAALSARIEEPPGERFLYNNFNLLLAGMVLERATGEHLATYLARHLWQPMGAEADGSWSLDSERSGFEKSESGINGRAMDFARFGWLHLREGRVGDRQVVPADWIREATARSTDTDPSERYQYWWWLDLDHPGRYYAHGNHGQFVYVAPDRDMVVVRMGRRYGLPAADHWRPVLAAVADRAAAAS